jgi:hypothetical protein
MNQEQKRLVVNSLLRENFLVGPDLLNELDKLDLKEFLTKIKPLAKYFLIRVPMINRSWLPLYKKELGLEYRLDKSHHIEYTYNSFKDEIESIGLKIVQSTVQFGEIWAKVEVK